MGACDTVYVVSLLYPQCVSCGLQIDNSKQQVTAGCQGQKECRGEKHGEMDERSSLKDYNRG